MSCVLDHVTDVLDIVSFVCIYLAVLFSSMMHYTTFVFIFSRFGIPDESAKRESPRASDAGIGRSPTWIS